MDKWEAVELGLLTTKIGSGATPRGGSNSYKSEGISLIRSQNVLDLQFSYSGLAFIDENQANALRNVTIEPNDVLLNITGDSVARVCKVPQKVLPARVNQHVAIIRADTTKILPDFLLYYLIFEKRELLSQSEIGATRRAITKGMIEKFLIRLPSIEIQKKISITLSNLDKKIDLLHRQNKTLEEMAEVLFREWFIEKAQKLWQWEKLDDHIEVMRGLSYKGAGLTDKENGIPMHNLNSVYEGGQYKYEGIKYYSGEYKERHLIYPGDVIVTNTEQGHDMRLIGCPAIIPNFFGQKGIFSQHIFRLKILNKKITKPFLYFLLKSYDVREQIISSTNGSTVNMLKKDGIEWAKFKMPPQSLITEFTNFAAPLLAKKENNYSQIRTLENLRDTLLPKLMNGTAVIV